MAIEGYQYRINGGDAVDVGLEYSELVAALSEATTYSFQIRAYDDAGIPSDWSEPVEATTLSPEFLTSDGEVVTSDDEPITVFM